MSVLVAAWMAMVVAGALRHRPRPVRALRAAATPTTTPRRARAGPLPPRLVRRRHDRRLRAAVASSVPDLVDLFAVAVAAGLNVLLATRAVARRAPAGPVADALRRIDAEVAAGARLADAIDRLPHHLAVAGRVDPGIRSLAAALVDAERYGAALGPTLDRLADEARRVRQRRAEEAARRVPVKLLFPLVTCVLPAFGLLTVAPLIAGGLRALRL